ncbi:rod shape-determining protein MreD [Marinisporobacter balticus]|uniref:Rod shape-determining protein MreD n=1 Tax=Marinisporobacter balticus TaxID=2018667 RepID=A0A4R2L0P7_9FIRM|nr:rod shape-determining protein MreD [Marinisporobacter balticus]TCO79984.1 rod shape-determining protein MreD [Marinisporobacter balticus]
MRALIISSIIILNFLMQSTLLQHFRILEILPNTSLIIVIVFAILSGKKRGAAIGFFTGMVQDILLGNMLGANTLIYMIIGYNIGIFEKNIYKDNYLTPVFFTIIATIIYHLMYYVIMYMTHNTINIFLLFRKIIFLEVIYNAIVSIFVYRAIFNISKHSYMKVKIR